MALKLMYITNRPDIAKIAENAGVDRVFIDMEYIGKAERQKGLDTAQHHHTFEDIKRIRDAISKAELMVRINPIHDKTADYHSTEEEIEKVIESGADIIMLPYFKTADEVRRFVKIVDGRAKTFPLLETPEAAENVDEILDVEGIDEIHVGINDLSIGYHKNFMFELLADNTIDRLCDCFRKKGIPYGFGGIASIGKGLIHTEHVIMEHYRLASNGAILSRSFCNAEMISDLSKITEIFTDGVHKIRLWEKYCSEHPEKWEENRRETADIIKKIAASM